MNLSGDDCATLAFGTRLVRIGRASGAGISLREQDCVFEARGSLHQRRLAKKYADSLLKQCGGGFMLDDLDDGDLTILCVPPEVVGYVQGHSGSVLRSIEDEWGSLMFFIDSDLSRAQRLAIFGSVRGRRGSELKVLSAVETKRPGFFMEKRNEVLLRDKYKDSTKTWGTDYMPFRDENEISYALGKQGGTRRKLERSSGAIVQYIGMCALVSGTRAERSRVRDYMKWLFQQLDGPVYVDDWKDRSDCSVVEIPSESIGYITGHRRATLGVLEEEWGTLMFFMNERGRSTEKLAIFGPERPRRGSQLKVMSGIEAKSPGYFTRGLREKTSARQGFDTDRLKFHDEEVSYALGKEGGTRKKLETTSGAILQYIGNMAYIAGSFVQRRRCRDYLTWLLQQRRGTVTITDTTSRDDCLEVNIPAKCKSIVTGSRGSELRRVEQVTGTYVFMALESRGDERLLIFGINSGAREHAERLITDIVQEKLLDDDYQRSRKTSSSRRRQQRLSRSADARRRKRSASRSSRGRDRQSSRRSRSRRSPALHRRGGLRGWDD